MATYDDVVKLAEQLSPADQIALIQHLLEAAGKRPTTQDEWTMLLDAVTSNAQPGLILSDRQEDWYGDDGR